MRPSLDMPTVARVPPPGAGQLAQSPVPMQLLAHAAAGTTGTLRLERGKVFKEILLHNGVPVGSRSNMRSEALGSMLVARGIISDSQLSYLLSEMKTRGTKMGETLIELGWMAPEDVLAFFAAQNKMRVVEALRWADGSFALDPDPSFLKDVIEHPLEIPGVVFWGLKKTAEPSTLIDRLLTRSARTRVRLRPEFSAYLTSFAQHHGGDLALALEGAPLVGVLLSGAGAGAAAVAVDALLLCGLADLEAANVATPAPRVATPPALPSRAARVAALRDQVERQAEDLAQLIASEIDSNPSSGPDYAVEEAAPADAFDEQVESGVISIDALAALRLQETVQESQTAPAPHAPAPAASTPPPIQTVDEVLREFLRIHGKSLYEVLDVERDASPARVLAAYEDKRRRFAPEATRDALIQERIQEIQFSYAHAYGVLSDPALRRAYDEEQRAAQQQAHLLDAELAFGEGRRLLKEGNPAGAAAALREACAGAPEQAQYRAWLAWAGYRESGDPGAARGVLDAALALDPDCADAHAFLGLIAHAQADDATAREHLERALTIDPTRLDALAALEEIYAATGEFHVTEQLYRRLLQGTDARNTGLVVTLWKRLGRLYEEEFEDLAAARTAYEVAARLDPQDADLQRKVVLLGHQELDRWRELARAMAAEWRLKPGEATLGTALFNLYRRVGKRDGASIVATAMVLRGAATAVHREIAQRHRARRLQRLSRPLDQAAWAALRHPDEHPLVESLLALLQQTGVMPPEPITHAGADALLPLAPERLPRPLAAVLRYVADNLGLGAGFAPRLCQARPGHGMALLPTEPVTLAIGADLLELADPVELAARLGRALAFAPAGRSAASGRTGRHLRPYLVACMAHGLKTVSSAEPEVLSVLERIAACPADQRERLADLGARIARERKTLNLSRWARALRHTSTRVALVLSRDLHTAYRIVDEAEDDEARSALLDFAVSPEHLDLRAALGVLVVSPPPLPTPAAERRSAERVDLEIDIGLESDNNLYTGILQDISTGGVFVATHQLRPVGEQLNVELRLPGSPGNLIARAEVSWLRQEGRGADDSAAGMGLRFIDPAPALIAACNRFLEQRESLFYDLD